MKNFSRQHVVREEALSLFYSSNKNRIKNTHLMIFFTIIAFFVIVTINGCSGSGVGGTPTPASVDVVDSGDSDPLVDPYVGSAKVSGTVKLSSLTSSDSSQLDPNTPPGRVASFRSKAVDTETEAVKLYVVGEGGELVDTGIACTLTEDGDDRAYECDGVKDDVNYIVRYVQITTTGKALELKASAYVPDGAVKPDFTTLVTPQSSVVTQALVSAILSSTAGAAIDDDMVNKIIESVKEAIEDLVTTGAIQIPSMIVDVTSSDLEAVVGSETENDKLDNAAGLVLADKTVDSELELIAADTQASQFVMPANNASALEKEAFIIKVFKDLLADDEGGSDDMGDIFINFFTWLYVENQTKPAGGLLDNVIGNIEYYTDDQGADIVPPATQELVKTQSVIDKFNYDMKAMYELLEINPASLSEAQKKTLVDFPPILRGLFPQSMGTITLATELNPPQAIALIIYFEDVFMPATVELNDSSTVDETGQISSGNKDIYDWSDKALFTFLGIGTYASINQGLFTGVEIFGLYLHPGSVWIDDGQGGQQHEALMGGTELTNLAGFVDPAVSDIIDNTSGAVVTLTYPKKTGGTGNIEFVYITHGDDPYGRWGIDPWGEAEMTRPQGSTDPVPIDPARVVSDFTSGTYTIKVIYNGTTTTKSFEKKVITGMTDKYVKITTPKGMPIWPGEDASPEEQAAFETAQAIFINSGGKTNFTANVIVLSDGSSVVPTDASTATHSKITVSWEPPDVVLPEGVKIVYDMNIGRQIDCTDGSTNCWEEIWNTWEENKRIYTTSFTIPHWFEKTDITNPYHLNIGVNFINQTTGEYLGQGGRAHTEFTVGNPIDLTALFSINGAINITDTNITPADLRIALVKETNDGAIFTRTVVRIADIIGETGYALDFEIGDFLSGSTVNTWYNLVLIEDAVDALGPDSELDMEPTYWPDYSSGGMWFDTWGGILKIGSDTCTSTGDCVHEENVITGGEIITGPKFYIGQNMYEPPKPEDVLPVPADLLTQAFTITGDVTIVTSDPQVENPKVILIEEGYDNTLDSHVQKVVRLATITGSTYSINTLIGDFFDSEGYPTDKHYQVILVDAYNAHSEQPAPVDLVAGDIIGYMNMWWPDWSTGGFGFDTWRGESLVIFTDSYDPSAPEGEEWTHTEIVNPSDTDPNPVTGPDLSNIDYIATAPAP